MRSPGFEPGSSAWEADVLPGWTTTAIRFETYGNLFSCSSLESGQSYFFLTFNLSPLRSRANSTGSNGELAALFAVHNFGGKENSVAMLKPAGDQKIEGCRGIKNGGLRDF